MNQIGRNLTDAVDGVLAGKRYLVHDRDPLFTTEFLNLLADVGVKSVKLPARSPNLNAYAERFVVPAVFSSVLGWQRSMIAAVSARRLPKLPLECAIEGSLRFVSDLGGNFRHTPRGSFQAIVRPIEASSGLGTPSVVPRGNA